LLECLKIQHFYQNLFNCNTFKTTGTGYILKTAGHLIAGGFRRPLPFRSLQSLASLQSHKTFLQRPTSNTHVPVIS